MLSCMAQLSEMQKCHPANTLQFLRQGLEITYQGFSESTLRGNMLIFEESGILHTLACTYHRICDVSKAISLINDIREGVAHSPIDNCEKYNQLAPVMLALSDLLMKSEKYLDSIDICDKGNEMSSKTNNGKYTPDFTYSKAINLYNLYGANECRALLQQAYFGYMALHKRKRAEQIREEAKKFKIKFKTYDVESIPYQETNYFFDFGELPVCHSVGELLKKLRIQQSLSTIDVYQGICSKSNYFKIENGEIEPHIYYLEVFMQRLGRDINFYSNTFLCPKDFEEKQIRDEVYVLLNTQKYHLAEKLLCKLEKKGSLPK